MRVVKDALVYFRLDIERIGVERRIECPKERFGRAASGPAPSAPVGDTSAKSGEPQREELAGAKGLSGRGAPSQGSSPGSPRPNRPAMPVDLPLPAVVRKFSRAFVGASPPQSGSIRSLHLLSVRVLRAQSQVDVSDKIGRKGRSKQSHLPNGSVGPKSKGAHGRAPLLKVSVLFAAGIWLVGFQKLWLGIQVSLSWVFRRLRLPSEPLG